MKKQELLQQLAAALVAAGLLTGVAVEGAAQDNQRGDRPSTAPAASRRPAAGALYGIVWETTFQRGETQKAQELEKAADALLAYANTAEGKADMESDAEFKKLIDQLRAIKARVQQERARQKAPASQPASQPR
jgi:hypothetical protein